MMQVMLTPMDTNRTSENPATCAGTASEVLPQHHSVPVFVVAHPAPCQPTSTVAIDGIPVSGVGDSVVVPVPPELPTVPQHRSPPSRTTAHVRVLRTEIATAEASEGTAVGRLRCSMVPSPSCPEELLPQHVTCPS